MSLEHTLQFAFKLMLNLFLLKILVLLEHVFFYLRLESNPLDYGVANRMLDLLCILILLLIFLSRLVLILR